MDLIAPAVVDCTSGQQTLAVKTGDERASFRCGEGLNLFPGFKDTGMQAYTSADSTTPVALTDIVPNATFTKIAAAWK